jgi:hypothetical protein
VEQISQRHPLAVRGSPGREVDVASERLIAANRDKMIKTTAGTLPSAAEIGGRIRANRKEHERLAADMKHVGAIIRMFNPDHNFAHLGGLR